jgi:hypothetical protein
MSHPHVYVIRIHHRHHQATRATRVAAVAYYKRGKRGRARRDNNEYPRRRAEWSTGINEREREKTFGNVKTINNQVGRLRSVVPMAHWSSLVITNDYRYITVAATNRIEYLALVTGLLLTHHTR